MVMAPMHGHPREHRSLSRHRSHHGECIPNRGAGLEGLMREESMKADRDSEAADDDHEPERRELDSSDTETKCVEDGEGKPEKRDDAQRSDESTFRRSDMGARDDGGELAFGRSGRLGNGIFDHGGEASRPPSVFRNRGAFLE